MTTKYRYKESFSVAVSKKKKNKISKKKRISRPLQVIIKIAKIEQKFPNTMNDRCLKKEFD